MRIRDDHPNAGGLVIAMDQEHARGIAALHAAALRRHPGRRAIATTRRAADRIVRFAQSADPWIVAVRMVSEGVDIPRLRVGVFATTTTTELFFRQAVGRLVRWTRGLGPQRSFLFVPDDPRLRSHVLGIAEERRHTLRRPDDETGDPAVLDEIPAARDHEQLSLFSVVSAVAVGGEETLSPHAEGHDEIEVGHEDGDDGTSELLELPPVSGAAFGPRGTGPTPRERRRILREQNTDAARDLVHRSGLTHAQVNAELNRIVGIRRITEATIAQLEERADQAERWMRKLA